MTKLLNPALAAFFYVSIFSSQSSGQEGANLIRKQSMAKAITTDSIRVPVIPEMSSARTSEYSRGENIALTNLQPSAAGAFPSLTPTPGSKDEAHTESKTKSGSTRTLMTVSSSLAIVLGLFAALIWGIRQFGTRAGGNNIIPKEIFQTLGSTSIDPRTQVSLIRCGQRILIIARTSHGVQSLGEITDKDEVRHLTATCTGESKQEFHRALVSFESEPTESGYISSPREPSTARSRGRLFASA